MIGEEPLDLPERLLQTTAVWWTAPTALLAEAQLDDGDVPGSLHAAEHASIGLLPLLATCDRWDLGGLSTNVHPQTGRPIAIAMGSTKRQRGRSPRKLKNTTES